MQNSCAEPLVHGGFLPLFRVSDDLLVLPRDGDTPGTDTPGTPNSMDSMDLGVA